MPFIVPFSVKVAITTGLAVGGSFAAVNNRERIFEITAGVLEKGAQFCRNRTKKAAVANVAFADDFEDGALAGYDEKAVESDANYDDELTTPEATDIDTDYEDINEHDSTERYDKLDTLSLD